MIKLNFWDGTSDVCASFKKYTANEFAEEFGIYEGQKVVLGSVDDIVMSVDKLAILKNNYNINSNLSDNEALKVIEDIMNAPQPELAPEQLLATHEEVQAVRQQLTEVELLILENTIGGK